MLLSIGLCKDLRKHVMSIVRCREGHQEKPFEAIADFHGHGDTSRCAKETTSNSKWAKQVPSSPRHDLATTGQEPPTQLLQVVQHFSHDAHHPFSCLRHLFLY